MSYLDGHNGTMPTCPCKLLHPSDILCARYGALLWVKVFWGILPVHGSLNGVPLLLLKTKSFLNNPKSHAIRVLTSSLRSSAFLATFVYLFQTGICLIRKMRPQHTRLQIHIPHPWRDGWAGCTSRASLATY
ncbi:hypothetical protein BASA62_010133 [Batrachochytrium salamandrivorans]|nr:hypothetical protein BASA62_010133 [Batrachochytrium salamandrivorans]